MMMVVLTMMGADLHLELRLGESRLDVKSGGAISDHPWRTVGDVHVIHFCTVLWGLAIIAFPAFAVLSAFSQPNKAAWYSPLMRPEWWLVVAAFLTLCAVYRQARESADATKAMRDSISLQEANLRQWVVVELIGSKPTVALFDSSRQIVPYATVEVRFQVVNPTPLPLTIKKVVTEISGSFEKSGPDWERFTVEDSETLKPKRQENEVGYPFYLTLNLVGERVKLYQSGSLLIAFSTAVFFESATGKMEEQSFASVVQCSPFQDKIVGYKGKAARIEKSESSI